MIFSNEFVYIIRDDADNFPILSLRDRGFVIMVATRDVRRHMASLQQPRFVGAFPDRSRFEETAIHAVYTSSPISLGCCSVEEVKPYFDAVDKSEAIGQSVCGAIAHLDAGAQVYSADERVVLYIDHILRRGRGPVGAIGSGTVICATSITEYDVLMMSTGLRAPLAGYAKNGPGVDKAGRPLSCAHDEVDELVRRLKVKVLGSPKQEERWACFADKLQEVLNEVIPVV